MKPGGSAPLVPHAVCEEYVWVRSRPSRQFLLEGRPVWSKRVCAFQEKLKSLRDRKQDLLRELDVLEGLTAAVQEAKCDATRITYNVMVSKLIYRTSSAYG